MSSAERGKPSGQDPELNVRFIDPHLATDHDLRRLVAEAMFSPSSQTTILYRYPGGGFDGIITSEDLAKGASGSLYDRTIFVNNIAMELGYSEKITVISKGPFPESIEHVIK